MAKPEGEKKNRRVDLAAYGSPRILPNTQDGIEKRLDGNFLITDGAGVLVRGGYSHPARATQAAKELSASALYRGCLLQAGGQRFLNGQPV